MFLRKIFLPNVYIFRSLRKPRGPDPGVNRQRKLLEKNDSQDMYENDPELIEQTESDFMNVHLSHKQAEQDAIIHREKLKQHIVKQKYFKVKNPNFLLYSEKEQIKLLHSREPNEWTPEKLSESFPADYETICKILKSNWVPNSKKRIEKHDSKALQNWESFKDGKLTDLQPHLKEHLNKFTERKTDDIKNLQIDFDDSPKKLPMPKKTEFLDIITRFEGKNENALVESHSNSLENKNDINNNPGENETYLTDEIEYKTPLRFRDLIMPSDDNKRISPEDKTINNPSGTGIVEKFNHSETNEIAISEKGRELFKAKPIEEHITIPENLWKKNATYKVEDCYYDDDGEFLYRVPGMTK